MSWTVFTRSLMKVSSRLIIHGPIVSIYRRSIIGPVKASSKVVSHGDQLNNCSYHPELLGSLSLILFLSNVMESLTTPEWLT
jgi:hypothetical protein